MKYYKIGAIAQLAGVSRRTIDYYTNLGLLKPVRLENNYRYYTEHTLARLKIIEILKAQRFTLEEIKEQFRLFELDQAGQQDNQINIDFIREQIKQLENQLTQLQPASNLDASQAAVLSRQVMIKGMAIMNALIIYINEITPFV
ncbi:MerR family transcriptional regulator [Desulfallas thermosapovorans]|uniref:DNA-binding transcriptional MerR regulator n=1 Tax=Desulfallas thermosapovorans DSM 6562 TaxID=1121431 RepID=A0A5S4ZW52_9FIRM|nr:MerR family transcriptional regulator [Desulfallas thermosapovorans]TYO97176.1 DNA-binding transcriptional MerR regulator [Desulfallas thermosapovorans DSM 6562]